MAIVYLLVSVALIVFLTAKLKVHPFIALLLVSIAYGLVSGMSFQQIIISIIQVLETPWLESE